MNEDKDNIALVIGGKSSSIGICVKEQLSKDFSIIETSKQKGSTICLDFYDRKTLDISFEKIKNILDGRKLEVVFINSGISILGDSYNNDHFFKERDQGDHNLIFHQNIVEFVKKMNGSSIIDYNTKIIYNASIQVLLPKKGYEDYARLKKRTSQQIMGMEELNTTILCLSLVKNTKMANMLLAKKINDGYNITSYLEEQFPKGQPTLEDINKTIQIILESSERTRKKYVIVDGGATLKSNLKGEDILFYSNGVLSTVQLEER